MLKKIAEMTLLVVLMILLFPAAALADVFVFCLDTSGSMNKDKRFEAAKAVLITQIEEARPGDVIHVIAFDSNDYPLGRVQIGEAGSEEKKAEHRLESRVRENRPHGSEGGEGASPSRPLSAESVRPTLIGGQLQVGIRTRPVIA